MTPTAEHHFHGRCPCFDWTMRVFTLSLLLLLAIRPCTAEESYWIPTLLPGGKLRYDVRVPDFFVPILTTRTDRGGGRTVTKTIDGKQYTFIKQALAWDKSGSHPVGTQQILLLNEEPPAGEDWKHLQGFSDHRDFAASLQALGYGEEYSWLEFLWVLKAPDESMPTVMVLKEGSDPPEEEQMALTIPEGTLDPYSPRGATNLMRRLAERRRDGEFYPSVDIPRNLDAFRRAMLEISNLARRDPDFRKKHGETIAVDLSADTNTLADDSSAQIHRNYSTPPYFDDQILNYELCQAAQFQAEYQASIKTSTHDGPSDFKGNDLSTFTNRTGHFGYTFATAGEAAAAHGGWDSTAYPRGWLVSDTHFGHYFNVGVNGFVREIGVGAAMADDGNWYHVSIGGMGDPDVTYWAKLKDITDSTKVRLLNGRVSPDSLGDFGGLFWVPPSNSSDKSLWKLEKVENNIYRIVNVSTSKLLVAGNVTETKLPYGRDAVRQMWELRHAGQGQYEFVNRFSARRLGGTGLTTGQTRMYSAEQPNDPGGRWSFQIVRNPQIERLKIHKVWCGETTEGGEDEIWIE